MELTPQWIVQELDKYIVGQEEAKKVVAIALCNRERRRKLPEELREEIVPKNILMIGPTGVGKTEIARRLAKIIDAPFIKVEATKFTEVGYVGRDVDSIINELVETAVMQVYEEELKKVEVKAEKLALERLLDYISRQLPEKTAAQTSSRLLHKIRGGKLSRERLARMLMSHKLDNEEIEIEVVGETSNSVLELKGDGEYWDISSKEGQRRWRKVSVKEARRLLAREEANKLINFEAIIDEALRRVEERGVVFIDEVDKLCAPQVEIGRDVSGEGVQRDLLPLVEGTTIFTRFGAVKTNHILFISAGVFSKNKPSDLIPEFQGRFPLRVELKPLSQRDLERILVEPKNALTKQYQALLSTEGVELVFTPDGISEIARMAVLLNERMENIGARRLYTIMEKVLEEINFTASQRRGERVVIDREYVLQHIGNLIKDDDISRYIL